MRTILVTGSPHDQHKKETPKEDKKQKNVTLAISFQTTDGNVLNKSVLRKRNWYKVRIQQNQYYDVHKIGTDIISKRSLGTIGQIDLLVIEKNYSILTGLLMTLIIIKILIINKINDFDHF